MEVQTFDGFSEEEQSSKAGFLEGYITGDLISMNYQNRIERLCDKNEKFCQKLKEFLEENKRFIETMIKQYNDNDFWHQMSLIHKQIEGMQSGYDLWKTHNKFNTKTEFFSNKEILLLNIASEISTLKDILIPERNDSHSGHCSAIVKPLPDGSDLFVAHNTWSDYDWMLRVMKKYSFHFKSLQHNKTKLIPGHTAAFPSYPGIILSSDDYYVLSSGLVVQETTIHNQNKTLTLSVKPNNCIPEFARNIIANRLAESGNQWTQIFSQYNSGTYNNQFMIIDYKLFKRGTKLSNLGNDLLWIVEQMPGLTRAKDVTYVLREEGYWASYNVPFIKQIYQISGNEELFRKSGSFYSWNSTARARIFRREESKVTDLKSLYSLMRYNDFKVDPLSKCQEYNQTCSPPYSADLTIAARNDLNDPKGRYPLYQWGHRGEGAIDAKLTNIDMVSKMEMIAVSGPTDKQQPPFQWSKSDLTLSHVGQPDLFNFKPIHVKWFPSTYQTIYDFD